MLYTEYNCEKDILSLSAKKDLLCLSEKRICAFLWTVYKFYILKDDIMFLSANMIHFVYRSDIQIISSSKINTLYSLLRYANYILFSDITQYIILSEWHTISSFQIFKLYPLRKNTHILFSDKHNKSFFADKQKMSFSQIYSV